MSALSVLSSFAPAAPGGTTPAPAEASANDDLFAGLVAAMTSGSGKEADATSDRTPASDTGDVQGSDAVAPTLPWPTVPLIAAAPVVVEAATAGASESAETAPALAPAAHPNSPAPDVAPLPAGGAAVSAAPLASPPQIAPAAKPIVQPGQYVPAAAPTIEPAPQPLAQSEAVARPASPAAPASAAPASEAPTPRPSPVVETAPLAPRQAVAPVRAPTADAPPAAPTAAAAAAAVGDDSPVPQGDESVVGTTPTAPQVVRTAATTVASAPSTAVASTIAPREPATPAKARPEAPDTVVSPPSSGEAPPTETTLRPALAPASRPPILASSPPPTAPVVVIDAAPEQAAPIPADGDSEAGPAKGQQAAATPPSAPAATSAAPTPPSPAAPPPPAAPPRNGSARLDERPSNAASTDVPAETGVSGARPAASTATAQNSAAPAPVVSDPTGGQAVAPLETALVDAPAALETPLPHQTSDLQDAAPTPARDLGLSQLSRATVETTAQIAAQILRKLDGRSTRFDMALTPEGLGRVDVSMEIDSEGRLSARLAFDNPAAATDLRSRADELRRQLQDAGFQLTQDSLEFSERNSSGFGGGGAFDRAPDRRAFAGAARLAAQADVATPPPGPWASLSLTPDRVDMKV